MFQIPEKQERERERESGFSIQERKKLITSIYIFIHKLKEIKVSIEHTKRQTQYF